ncbi:type VII secretion target [Amycolatopsis sp. H20-H5]|uniref:type VII secretion target n=1 Tax=Amycolatopsis sp. H20-H5 TaxID=3046309 RepID=UPI002DBF41AE|nr:type VII secretion target [Amycolatopsis sp. H20-H5]MEC3977222.1 type VII secretion target [Amycolatopsis sp. H20-H5]
MGLTVGFDELAAHEAETREVADQVKTAVEASGEAQALNSDAFGIVGQVFAIPIQIFLTQINGMLRDASDAGHEVADRLKTAHTLYKNHETTTKAALEGIGKELPS